METLKKSKGFRLGGYYVIVVWSAFFLIEIMSCFKSMSSYLTLPILCVTPFVMGFFTFKTIRKKIQLPLWKNILFFLFISVWGYIFGNILWYLVQNVLTQTEEMKKLSDMIYIMVSLEVSVGLIGGCILGIVSKKINMKR